MENLTLDIVLPYYDVHQAFREARDKAIKKFEDAHDYMKPHTLKIELLDSSMFYREYNTDVFVYKFKVKFNNQG